MRTSAQRSKRNATTDVVARDIMTEDPMVLEPSATIAEAMEILASLEIRHLPVMRDKELVGMISERDVYRFADDDARRERSVATVMNTNVISVEPDASIPEVAAALVENRIGAVPVVDGHDGDVVGIVSYVDVLRDLAKNA
jgi:acetoin utilization protein AcuB